MTTSTITETTADQSAIDAMPQEAPPRTSFLASLPRFGPPRAPRSNPDSAGDGSETSPSTRTTTAAADSDGDGRGAQDTGTFTPASFKNRSKGYAAVAATLLRALGGYLNAATRLPETDAFLPDDEDEEAIAPPLGRLAARRIKLGADPEAMSDIEDIAQASIGAVVWLAKGIGDWIDARRERKRAESGRAVHTDAGDGAQQ